MRAWLASCAVLCCGYFFAFMVQTAPRAVARKETAPPMVPEALRECSGCLIFAMTCAGFFWPVINLYMGFEPAANVPNLEHKPQHNAELPVCGQQAK